MIHALHPLVVHFPVALLITSLVFECLWRLFHVEACRVTARGCLIAGTIGAAFAVWSGLEAAEVAVGSVNAYRLMDLHEKLGITVLCGSLLLSGFSLAMRKWKVPFYPLIHLLVLLGIVATLTVGAYLGGRLVYEFGLGTHIRSQNPPDLKEGDDR